LLSGRVAHGHSTDREAAYRRAPPIEAEIRDRAEFVVDIPLETGPDKTGLSIATAELSRDYAVADCARVEV